MADGVEKVTFLHSSKLSQDLKSYMTDQDAHYTFSVRVISREISKIAHGDEIDSEDAIDLPEENEKIEDKIDNLLNSDTVGDAPEKLSEDISKLQAAMRTDKAVREKVEKLEQKYME